MSEDADKLLPEDIEVIAELKNIAQQHQTLESAVNELSSRLPFTEKTNLQIVNNTEDDIDLLFTSSDDENENNDEQESSDPDLYYDASSHTHPAADDTQYFDLVHVRQHHRRRLSQDLQQFLMNRPTFHDLGVDDTYIWHTVCNNHKRKVSQLAALIEQFQIHYFEDRAIRLARDKMKNCNPLNLQKIQAINYRIIIQRVLRNNDNINEQLQALKSELMIYFVNPIANHVATNSIKYWRQNNLLMFGYIAEMEKLKIISNSIPYDIVILILEFFCNKHYEYEYGFKWQNIVTDASKCHRRKISQFTSIKTKLSSYFDDEEECRKMAKTLMTSMYTDQCDDSVTDDDDDDDDNDNERTQNNNETFAWWDWTRDDE